MEVKEASFEGQRLRYLKLPQNGLLFNTKDFCSILNIEEREPHTEFASPCIDFARAVLGSAGNESFLDWLLQQFSGYEAETSLHPNCNDDWEF